MAHYHPKNIAKPDFRRLLFPDAVPIRPCILSEQEEALSHVDRYVAMNEFPKEVVLCS